MRISDLVPNPEVLLALEPEELAGYVLEILNAKPERDRRQISPSDFASGWAVESYPSEQRSDCSHALMEAWAVLVRQALVAQQPGNPHPIYFLTRRGLRLRTREIYREFLHAEAFPRSLIHPLLAEQTFPLFIRADYETAIFQAFKLVEVTVRNGAFGRESQLYGVDLMRRAFHTETGPLTDTAEPVAEREALQALFAGSIGRFKNPSSHRHVEVTSPGETIEVLQLASLLLRTAEERTSTRRIPA